MNVTLNVSTDEGEFGFAPVHDGGNALVGAWLFADEGNTGVVWLLPNGTFLLAEDGVPNDPTGQDGMEAGTWAWNSGTGDFTRTVVTDTNGEWGMSDMPSGLSVQVSGDLLQLTVPGEGTRQATRIGGSGIQGGWYTLDGGEAGGPVAFAFLANGQYFMAQDGSSVLDPSGADGMERGSYTWNAGNGAFTRVTTVDTNGEWGMSHGAPSTMILSYNGGPGDDAVDGTHQAEVLQGFEGNDTLDGLEGNDTIHGGDGFDMAVFSGNLADNLIESGSVSGTFTVTGPDGVDYLTGIEALEFEDGVYFVSEGTESSEAIGGGNDAEIIRGRGGNDTISGGGGDDGLFGDEGDDELSGGSGNDVLDGGTGNDDMRGGTGDDTYVVDAAGDSVVEPDSLSASQPGGPAAVVSVGGGIDRVVAGIDYALGNAIENLSLAANAGGIAGTGNALANAIAGNEANNALTGAAGNDSLDGAAGIDIAVYSGSRDQCTFNSSQVDATLAGEGVDAILGIERLAFSDVNVAIDLDGNAGSVAKVLGAVFGQAALDNEVYAGIGLEIVDGGVSYEALMGLALNVALGANATSAQVVTLLYTNVIGSPPDDATRDAFAHLIDSGTFTKAGLAAFAGNYMGVPEAVAGGLEYV